MMPLFLMIEEGFGTLQLDVGASYSYVFYFLWVTILHLSRKPARHLEEKLTFIYRLFAFYTICHFPLLPQRLD